MRLLTALLCLVSITGTGVVVRTSAPVGAATAAPVVNATQDFTGGGSGVIDGEGPQTFPRARYSGAYTSTGQLGLGAFTYEADAFGSRPTDLPAAFTRADGTSLVGRARTNPHCQPVPCLSLDLAGTADVMRAQIDMFAVTKRPPAHRDLFDGPGSVSFLMRGTLTLRHRIGYVMIDPRGSIFRFGGIEDHGEANTTRVTDIEMTPTMNGYWIVNAAGQVYTFGDATDFGGADASTLLPRERVTTISVTPSGNGYWLFTTRGRVMIFGHAQRYGEMRSVPLNGEIVGSIATPTGRGYYMVGSDGGVFAFGDARFRGSMGNVRLNRPVVGMVPTSDNTGYWLVASDGGVFAFDAPFHGSMGATPLNQPVVTMVPYAGSYLMIASDGGVFNFSAGPFLGSLGDALLPEPMVSGAAAG